MNTKEILESIKDSFENDTKIEIEALTQYCLNIPRMYKKYLDLYIQAQTIANKKKTELKNLYAQKYIDYKINHHISFKTKNELDDIIKGDKDYLELEQEYKEWLEIIAYLEKVLDYFKSVNYLIKNIIDWEKVKVGM